MGAGFIDVTPQSVAGESRPPKSLKPLGFSESA